MACGPRSVPWTREGAACPVLVSWGRSGCGASGLVAFVSLNEGDRTPRRPPGASRWPSWARIAASVGLRRDALKEPRQRFLTPNDLLELAGDFDPLISPPIQLFRGSPRAFGTVP